MATAVVPTNLPSNVCRDANDIPVLGTAVAASALVLVTVDKDLLALDGFQGIAIIKPGETILGMSLPHGGHLSHGTSVSHTGQVWKSQAYGVRPETGH